MIDLGEERKSVDFKKYIGVGEFTVLGFSLDRNSIIQKCGYDPGSEQQYTKMGITKVNGVDKEVKTANVTAFLKDVNTGVGVRVGFIFKDAEDIAQSGNIKYVNSKCENSYVLMDWFKKHEHRKAYIGEADFLQFIRNWLSNFRWFDKDNPLGGAKYPLKENMRLLDGNFAAINDLAKRYPHQTIGVLCGIRESDKGQRQDACNRAFLPGELAPFAQSLVVGDNTQAIASLPNWQATTVRNFLEKVEGQYGYKNFYGNSYKFREYDPKTNVVAGNNSAVINTPQKSADELSY